MEIITGYRGEPHITSVQDRAINQGCFGEGSYILDVGSKLEPEIISVNEIRINDGVLSHQGCVASIASGTYDSLSISNGSQGMNRADLIVARYTRDSSTLIENMELVVIEGTPASGTPSLPVYNDGSIQAGDSPVDMPLFRVNLEGVNIDGVVQIAENVKTQKEIDTTLDAYATDSGWTNATLTSDFANYASANLLRYRKIGKIVTLTGVIRPTGTITGSSDTVVICTLPSGYRPAQVVHVLCQGSSKYSWLLIINSGGNVTFSRYGSSGSYVDALSTSWLPLHATFFT